MTTLEQGLSLAEFLALPEEKPALEFADGKVTQKVSPKGRHSALQLGICERFNRFGVPKKRAYALPGLRATFAGVSRVPDVAVYRWNRIPRTPSGEVADDFFEPPDIAVEILSPGQSVNALVRRCLWFVENGVRVALLVDAADRSFLCFRANLQPQAQYDGERVDLDEIMPDFPLTVDDVFAALTLE